MKYYFSIMFASCLAVLAGCATTQNIELAKMEPPTKIESVSQVLHDGNSTAMNDYLQSALKKEGLIVKSTLPTETKTSQDVDALVSYDDIWRWDLKMYLFSISIHINDAKTGDLLAIGRWNNSAFHGFQDPKEVVQELVTGMMAKLRGSQKPAK